MFLCSVIFPPSLGGMLLSTSLWAKYILLVCFTSAHSTREINGLKSKALFLYPTCWDGWLSLIRIATKPRSFAGTRFCYGGEKTLRNNTTQNWSGLLIASVYGTCVLQSHCQTKKKSFHTGELEISQYRIRKSKDIYTKNMIDLAL